MIFVVHIALAPRNGRVLSFRVFKLGEFVEPKRKKNRKRSETKRKTKSRGKTRLILIISLDFDFDRQPRNSHLTSIRLRPERTKRSPKRNVTRVDTFI